MSDPTLKANPFTATKSTMGIRAQGSQPMVFQRDLVYALPIIFKNATILTELGIKNSEDSDEVKNQKLLILDTISQFFVRLWADGRKDNPEAIRGLGEYITYVSAPGIDYVLRQEIFAIFNNFVVINLFTYMFGSKAMSKVSPTSMDESCYTIDIFSSILAMIDDKERTEIVRAVKRAGILPTGVNLSGFFIQSKNYLEDIRKEQEKLYGISNAAKEESSGV